MIASSYDMINIQQYPGCGRERTTTVASAGGEGEPQMSVKFEHCTQLGLEGSVSRAPIILKAVAFLSLVPLS